MNDDKSKRGGEDGDAAGDEPYELAAFAKRHGLTAQEAQHLLEKHGDNRNVLDFAAAKMKGEGQNG